MKPSNPIIIPYAVTRSKYTQQNNQVPNQRRLIKDHRGGERISAGRSTRSRQQQPVS
ncbi:hypothetical protein E4U61_007160 [Claviceps capensis]|nr:hypothetical protein E4U61_007160 [Claviceps capensis]